MVVVAAVVGIVVVVDGEWESVERKSRNKEGFAEVKM
jgi:hypothetical protein